MASGGLAAEDLLNVKKTFEYGDSLGNTSDVEFGWAVKAGEHADVYFRLISSVDPSLLRLTKVDEEIYTLFRATFPSMAVDVIDEDQMKSAKGKQDWREFIEYFRGKVQDYNLGTMLRLSCKEGYTEENTTICVRTQFLAIEIARNREKHNDRIRYTHGKLKDTDQSDSPSS